MIKAKNGINAMYRVAMIFERICCYKTRFKEKIVKQSMEKVITQNEVR